ncbi:TetR family transcriptional regulator C-terminal domain-containing protein [Nocardia sp. NPDC050175]|uniref:TetR family transcriptional regulator C-terminal domain-containing protein n=1 Tax=Nocardia sp. NPDC050175 TaxID=3364317 RepID=UPI0037A840BB
MQDASRDALTEVLRVAIARGEIAAQHDPHTLAAFLVTFLNGLLVSSKITPDVHALEPSWRSPWSPSTDFFMPAI